MERGLNLPDVSIMRELCEILDVSLNELFEGQILTSKELKNSLEKNIMIIMMTKEQLEIMQIFTEILIFAGIIITITLRSTMAITKIQKFLVILIGIFVWGFGIFLRIRIKKALINLEKQIEKD